MSERVTFAIEKVGGFVSMQQAAKPSLVSHLPEWVHSLAADTVEPVAPDPGDHVLAREGPHEAGLPPDVSQRARTFGQRVEALGPVVGLGQIPYTPVETHLFVVGPHLTQLVQPRAFPS